MYIYIASPYSHKDAEVRNDRYEKVAWFAADQIKKKKIVYSPILHNHPIAVKYKLPKMFRFWEKFDQVMIDGCDELWVLKLPEWEHSRGVKLEVEYAIGLGKKVTYFNERGDVEPLV